jgi:hypothetical protein
MISTITQNDVILHKKWLNDEPDGVQLITVAGKVTIDANLSGADLSRANLSGADLSRANLRGANIDFSAWPLWCGSKGVKVDARIAAQIAAHLCALDCDDPGYLAARDAVLEFAKTSHRAKDLGLLDERE